MPAEARGHARRLASGKWQLRYYDRAGTRRTGGAFDSKTEALNHYRDVIEPELHGRATARRDLTLQQLADLFLHRHAKVVTARTAKSLRERLARPLSTFGTVPLSDLEGMTDELAGFAAGLPERYRYSVMSAFRQTLEAGVRYGVLARNPAKLSGKNPQPKPRGIRVFTPDEIGKITVELDERGAAVVRFAAATGLRPGEWSRVERRDLDRARRVLSVRGTKTQASRREVPLTASAVAAIDSLPARLDTPYVFAGVKGGPFDFANFGKRDWHDAIESAGIAKPARLYDLRSTFASNALAAGITVYELARIMGTSVRMIEMHYGALLDTANESMLERLETFGALEGHGQEAEDASNPHGS
jgi:integrase